MASISKYCAPGILALRKSSLPSRFLFGKYQVASKTFTLAELAVSDSFSESQAGVTTGSITEPPLALREKEAREEDEDVEESLREEV